MNKENLTSKIEHIFAKRTKTQKKEAKEGYWVGASYGESVAMLSYRLKLSFGDSVITASGLKGAVIENDRKEYDIKIGLPVLVNGHELGFNALWVPYTCIMVPGFGHYCSDEDFNAKVEALEVPDA